MNSNFEDINILTDFRKSPSGPKRRPSIKYGTSPVKFAPKQPGFAAMDTYPVYLTPSKRLHLRKQQINQRITMLKHNSSESLGDIHSDDEEIGLDDQIFNVPLAPSTKRNIVIPLSRNSSLASESTTNSSIFSRNSMSDAESTAFGMHSCSLLSCSLLPCSKKALPSNLNRLGLSADALELTRTANDDEKFQIVEIAKQNTKLLSLFLNFKILSSDDPRGLQASLSKSSESKAYFLNSRPSWLPPKNDYDRMKHQRDAEKIVQKAIREENILQMKRVNKLKEFHSLQEKDSQVWNRLTESEIKNMRNDPSLSEMYWRGIPRAKRATIWHLLLIDRVSILKSNCEHRFSESRKILQCACDDGSARSLSFSDILDRDLNGTYAEANEIRDSDVHQALKETIVSFLIYMGSLISQSSSEVFDTNDVSGTYFRGLCNLSAMLYHVFQDKYLTFRGLCALFTHDELLNALVAMRLDKAGTNRTILSDYVQDVYFSKIEDELSTTCPRLFEHFQSVGLKTADFAPDMIIELFSGAFDLNLSALVFDIWLFEGSSFLIATLLALLKVSSHKLFGSKEEILSTLIDQQLEEKTNSQLNVGYAFEFVETIREIT